MYAFRHWNPAVDARPKQDIYRKSTTMKSGYLYLQTHAEHPGLVRCLVQDQMPSKTGKLGVEVRYIARFKDIDAAQMHLQNSLRGSLVDINEHLYRVGLPQALAIVEADELSHERIWLDDSLDNEARELVQSLSDGYRQKYRIQNLVWQLVGGIALVLLLLGLLGRQ